MAKLVEDLTKNNENQVKSGGVWGGVAPPARAAENMPKASQEPPKIFKNLRKSTPGPPQIDAKTVLNDILKEHRINNALGKPSCKFFEVLKSSGSKLEIKIDMRKQKDSESKF